MLFDRLLAASGWVATAGFMIYVTDAVGYLGSVSMTLAKDVFGGAISEVEMANKAPALQLARLSEVGALIRTAIERRVKGQRHAVEADWRRQLDDHLAERGAEAGDELVGDEHVNGPQRRGRSTQPPPR